MKLKLRALLLAVLLVAGPQQGVAADEGPTVFAAASLKNALDAVAADWKEAGNAKPIISYAASSTLAKQIEQGADADIVISADLDWMDYLEERNLIDKASRFSLLGNRLVLIAPKDSKAELTIAPGFPIAGALGDSRLAIAGVEAVPAGKYGKAAFEKLGVWEQVKDKLAQAENVRAALLLVSRGETPLGIVYASDAKADSGVKVVGVFPEDTHPPIVYPAAKLASSKTPSTGVFLDYLRTPEAVRLFEGNGFTVLESQ